MERCQAVTGPSEHGEIIGREPLLNADKRRPMRIGETRKKIDLNFGEKVQGRKKGKLEPLEVGWKKTRKRQTIRGLVCNSTAKHFVEEMPVCSIKTRPLVEAKKKEGQSFHQMIREKSVALRSYELRRGSWSALPQKK